MTRSITVGSVDLPVVDGGLQLPWAATPPVAGEYGTGWVYTCTAVGPLSDPSLVGRWWLVVNSPAKSFATARRLDVAEIPKPDGIF